MASTSGSAKIQRAVNQLENVERLLLSLPKLYFRKKRDRELIESLARDIIKIKETIERELSEENT